MIYIFDDRWERYEKNKSRISVFGSIIKFGKFVPSENVEEYYNFHFSDAEMVIIHSSYRFLNNKCSLSEVIKIITKQGIPIVIFSGGIQRSSISKVDNTWRVNSSTLYANLPYFLKCKEEDRNPPVEMLLWGANYVKNQILFLLCEIYSRCLDKDFDEAIDENMAFILDELISDTFKSQSLEKAKKVILDTLYDNIGKLTYNQFVNLIENLMQVQK